MKKETKCLILGIVLLAAMIGVRLAQEFIPGLGTNLFMTLLKGLMLGAGVCAIVLSRNLWASKKTLGLLGGGILALTLSLWLDAVYSGQHQIFSLILSGVLLVAGIVLIVLGVKSRKNDKVQRDALSNVAEGQEIQ